MRLDKFLKVSRVIKRRTVANEACDGGRVSVNGRVAKPGADIKPGDVVEVAFASGSVKFEILSVAETVSKSDASSMYRIIQE
ncbi:MAG: RNA-binding S4 domain-containing protein [Clostridia bacterium]|jgi:ribosomal 50S subunit-recycling heat shock protein|nr:RNA-binding S4 domain-containing protein [Clostridia bacterium]MBQ3848405.1 RNA-binding S4 domain-containing protein [Clostridia bacterium]